MNSENLEGLHAVVAKELLKRVKSGEASAAELSAAIKFLKDNGIDCYGKANETVSSLADTLDFPVDVDDEFYKNVG